MFCPRVILPRHAGNAAHRCAPLCTAVCGCVCARALVTHAKSLPIPEGELLLPWTTSIPYESHKHHYFQERCQWQLCWLTLVVSVAWWPVAAGPGADISVSRFQSCLQMSKFKDGDVSPSTGFPCSKTRERERVYLIPYQVQSLVSDKEDTLSNGDRVMLAREKHDGHAGG